MVADSNSATILELDRAARRDHRAQRIAERLLVSASRPGSVTYRQTGAAAEFDVEVTEDGSRGGIRTDDGFDRLSDFE